MADATKIEWSDSTFNPWIGCTKVSPACDHCYAAVSTPARALGVEWGAGQPRLRTSVANWKAPLRWNAVPFWQCEGCGWRGDEKRRLSSYCPNCCSGVVVPARRRVFCASLADVFDNEVAGSWRSDLFNLIRATPNLDWLLLTKRIGNVTRMLDDCGGWSGATATSARNPLPNVWLGATVCNQDEADRDIPKLLATPARVRFLSMEPLLGPVDLTVDGLVCLPCRNADRMRMDPTTGAHECCRACDYTGIGDEWGIDWVVAGGESGPGARPMHPDWARSLRDQCAVAGVPFLFKQWGEWGPEVSPPVKDAHRWPITAAQPRDGVWSYRVGKKAAGRELDGVMHTAFPA